MQLDLPFFRSPPEPPQPDTGIEFIRVRGARRYILRVRPDGRLRVTVPRWGSKREALAFVEKQRRWIERERARVLADCGPREWDDGSTILLDGQAVRITIEGEGTRRVAIYGGRRVHLRDGVGVREAIEADLRALAREQLVPRLEALAALHGLPVGRVTIRNQRSRWGSCSPAGAIALNLRLVQTPPDVRDYVLLHELMHLRQQNHSRRFWRLVQAACPSFREAERWLKVQGKALF
jgi:predicted metal-dependent hydrolase